MSNHLKSLEDSGWFMKYRPLTVDDYVFENSYDSNGNSEQPSKNEQMIRKFIDQGHIDGNLLLYGKAGSGKTSLVNILTIALNKSKDVKKVETGIDYLRDTLAPMMKQSPIYARKKILVLNEFGPRNTSPQALNFFNDQILENYQKNNSFIATTNDYNLYTEALSRRFNYKIQFKNDYDLNQLFKRLSYILTTESIEFTKEVLIDFMRKVCSRKMNIGDIINEMQNSCSGGRLVDNPNIVSSNNSGSPDELLNQFINIYNKINLTRNMNELNGFVYNPAMTSIADEYKRIIEITTSITVIDYYEFFDKLKNEYNDFIPVRNLIETYQNELDSKKFKYLTVTAFLLEFIKVFVHIKNMGYMK